ncbi:MAG: Fic family protein [Acidobacteria bacterium]|nr:Fic family protein [Acidobacteriota bacterium]
MSMPGNAGEFIGTKYGYDVFIPNPLPPDINYDEELQLLLSKADGALARLDGVTEVLPNPDLFVAMYVKKEALLSAQIEGTEVSLKGVLEFEANIKPKEDIADIREVINYIEAMHYGMEMLENNPLDLNLIHGAHKILIAQTRGSDKQPGRYKTAQNYLGMPGCTIYDASFIPPPPERVEDLMKSLETFIQAKDNIPTLIKIALIHSQFETIHPYLDGNGRMGRLLISYYLYWKKILSKPLLYLSFYLKKNKSEYSECLNGIRYDNNWEAWLKFFLKGVIETSENALHSAREIIALKEKTIEKLILFKAGGINAVKLIDHLFEDPTISVKEVSELLNVSNVTANKLVNRLEEIGILMEFTGKKRYKKYVFTDFVRIIERGTQI